MDVLLAGDINCKDDGVLSSEPLSPLAGEFAAADLRIGNLEGAFHDPAVGLAYKPGWYHCEPEMISRISGYFDVVGCANNVHFGEAIAASNRWLDQAGIAHTGADENAAAARRPVIVERAGVRLGVLAYTSIFWPIGHAAGENSPGVATIGVHTSYEPHPRVIEMPAGPAIVRSQPCDADLAVLRQDIAALREQVDVLVTYFHWGVTGIDTEAEYQRTLGRSAIDAGADLVAGSHPHIPQGIELYGRGAILYSLGNFMFGWKLHTHMTRDGLLARVRVRKGEPWSLSFVPVMRTDQGQITVQRPDSLDGQRIGARVAELSRGFDTVIEPADGWYAVRRADGTNQLGVPAAPAA